MNVKPVYQSTVDNFNLDTGMLKEKKDVQKAPPAIVKFAKMGHSKNTSAQGMLMVHMSCY